MEELLSELLEAYLRRRAAGETPRPEEYRERAGAHYADFVEMLAAESALDAALGLEPDAPLPRAFGRYTLLRELGRGAVGVVYEAHHRDLGRNVALKILRTGFDTSALALERFRREAVACAQVRHDHIVEVYEAGDVEGRPYFAMAKLEGRSLREAAKAGELPPPTELCKQLAGVADALHELHERDIVHRDVKPSNIMVEPNGRMVLADFGLARTLDNVALTQTGEALGTPLYMSPEQLLGRRREVDRRTDVYGLGATLYEVLAGRALFAADDIQAMVHQILEERPAPLRRIRPDLPEDCARIAMTAIEKRREDRYQSAAAMRDDLLAFAAGHTISGKPVSAARHKLRRVARHWRPIAAAAVVLAAAGIWYVRRPARLRVLCEPSAEILLDSVSLGFSPQDLDVSPGKHLLTLRTGGFLERSQPLDLDAGETRSIELILIADDPDNPVALEKLAKRYRIAVAKLAKQRPHRGAKDRPPAQPVFPRGVVRLGDVDTLRIDVRPDFLPGRPLQFFIAQTKIHEQPFDPLALSTTLPLPAEVRKALQPGLTIRWGFPPHLAEFRIMKSRAIVTRIKKMGPLLAKQDPALVATLRANRYLASHLYYPAYREAEDALAAKPTAHACAVMQAALRGMGLENSKAADDLEERIAELPPDARAKAGGADG